MRNYIENYLNEYEFPILAKQEFLTAYDKITSNKIANELLLQTISDYKKNYDVDFNKVCNEYYKTIQLECGIHPYTTGVIFAICLCKQLKIYYKQREYTEEMYKNALADIKYKVMENSPINKIWGWENKTWLDKFLKFERFGFDQLQFNLNPFLGEYHKNGVDLYPDSQIITVHLPMTGQKLNADQVPNTFKKAGEFFKQFLKDKPIVFYCRSWLLFSGHLHVLKEGSQILKFRNLFEIIGEKFFNDYSELKRLFHTTDFSDIEKLPCETSLQRHYIEVLKNGEKTGHAWGIYVYQK